MLTIRMAGVFLIFVATFSVNHSDNFLCRLLGESSFLITLVAALCVAVVLSGRSVYVIAAVLALGLNANLPADFALNFGIDRDLYAGVMISTLMVPFLSRYIE